MYRRDLMALLSSEPRSISSIARQLGLKRDEVEDDMRHALRSARAAGHTVSVTPARCRSCGFTFGDDRLAKPSRCPACRGSRILEAQLSLLLAPDARSDH